MAEPRIVRRDDPEDVFTLVSDDTRVEILQALWETDEPVAFSELHEAVGIRDSGQFNYHLDKLVDRFVRKTPEGYELTQAGKQINGSIEAGSYTLEATFDPIDLEDPCPYCDGDRTLAYEDEVVDVECSSCDLSYHFVVPPGAFAGHDQESIPQVSSRYLHATFHQIKSGFCWFCEGHTRPTVEVEAPPAQTPQDDDLPHDESGDPTTASPEGEGGENPEEPCGDGGADDGEVPVVHYDCERCGHTATAGLWLSTLDHPAVRSFYYEHGIDVRDRPIWEFPVFDTDHLSVRSRNPLRASVTYTVGGETLTLVVDGDADVIEVEP